MNYTTVVAESRGNVRKQQKCVTVVKKLIPKDHIRHIGIDFETTVTHFSPNQRKPPIGINIYANNAQFKR